jgi:hypothetical protein
MSNKPNYVIERIEGLEGVTTLFQDYIPKTNHTETSNERVERWNDEMSQSPE